MPIYEFICEKCKQSTEVLQKISDDAPSECGHCHAKNTLKKAVSNSSFQLKGGGWYKDAYTSKKPESNQGSKN